MSGEDRSWRVVETIDGGTALVHQDANVHESARLRGGVRVEAQARIGERAYVGRGAKIMAEATISPNVWIGPETLVEFGATIGEGARLDECVWIGRWAKIGPGAMVDADTRIGPGALVGAEACIGHGSDIPERAAVPAGSIVGPWTAGFIHSAVFGIPCSACWSRAGEIVVTIRGNTPMTLAEAREQAGVIVERLGRQDRDACKLALLYWLDFVERALAEARSWSARAATARAAVDRWLAEDPEYDRATVRELGLAKEEGDASPAAG